MFADAEGFVALADEDVDEWGPGLPVHVTALRYLRFGLELSAHAAAGGGAGSHSLPGHVIRIWTVNMTLARVIALRLGTLLEIPLTL
jgi:hypothetical protein